MGRKKKREDTVDGTNALAWVNPYERDTTRGGAASEFESMHQSVPHTSLTLISCTICGVSFYTATPEIEDCGTDDWLHDYLRKGGL